MPTLIRLIDGRFEAAEDRFTDLADDAELVAGPVILSLTRFQAESDALVTAGRQVGVRLAASEAVEDLAYDLPRLALVAPVFPKFRDGRAFTTATLLRQRLGFTGEVRALGDVLREQAFFMVRCGFDSFVPADGSTAEDWSRAAGRFRHVYQRAADDRAPAFVERAQ
ncbi:MAG: DUF934 domain-containing protein [Caulobacter sp.]|nr:DUF934 domain-containing protein [Caulobacter sp.]